MIKDKSTPPLFPLLIEEGKIESFLDKKGWCIYPVRR